jgi:CheY-like chemotaxis protein
VARAVAFIPDLLFGSNVVGMLQAGGHEPVLVSNAADLAGALDGADVLIVDLTADAGERIAAVNALPERPPTLAFYAHVEDQVRAQARAAGFDLVVPRSRMARAGAELVGELV